MPCGRVNDLKGLFQGQTAKELKLVKEVEGKKFVRNPIRSNIEGVDITLPPGLNDDGKSIL